jgi:hypothetical protein
MPAKSDPAPPSGKRPSLLVQVLAACVAVFALLQVWRPCYFLTDDNLSAGFPFLVEVGRHLHEGRSPFISDYLFGGHYNELRDLQFSNWHPVFFAVALLAGTGAQFWMLDLAALVFLLVAATGFVSLAQHLRREYALPITDGWLVFYTLSFLFSTFMLTIGPSWLGFLVNQSSLPWLVLGILEKRVLRGTVWVALFTANELLGGYFGLLVSGTLCLSVFALGVALGRRQVQPVFQWAAGNLLAALLLLPLLLPMLDGFAHSVRAHGLSQEEVSLFAMPPSIFIASLFAGNWTEPMLRGLGDSSLTSLAFPYLPTLLACPAAWCLFPACLGGRRWRGLDTLCAGLALGLAVMMIRPALLAAVMQHLPLLRSMRWPFREGLFFLFFIHVLLVLRFPTAAQRWQWASAVFGLTLFLAPLPWIAPPTFNPLALDRSLLFSGRAEKFWALVKPRLGPDDEIATVIDWPYWQQHFHDIPYTLLGTANFPALFQVRCVAGYSNTAPADQVPLKLVPGFWFGAFREDQRAALLAERPNLRVLEVVSTQPLEITLSSPEGPPIDLTPDLRAAGITAGEPPPPPAR